jgi:hypothetical protein
MIILLLWCQSLWNGWIRKVLATKKISWYFRCMYIGIGKSIQIINNQLIAACGDRSLWVVRQPGYLCVKGQFLSINKLQHLCYFSFFPTSKTGFCTVILIYWSQMHPSQECVREYFAWKLKNVLNNGISWSCRNNAKPSITSTTLVRLSTTRFIWRAAQKSEKCSKNRIVALQSDIHKTTCTYMCM